MKRSFLGSLLFVATAAFGQLLPPPDTVSVSLYGEDLRDARSVLVGRGIVHGRRSVVTSTCGSGSSEIVWREVRRITDPEGGTHAFYRQHLVGDGLDAELSGSEVGVHRTSDGRLLGIGGRQFESVIVSGCPTFGAAEAVEQAYERVLLYKGQYAQREPWAMNATRNARLAQAELKLVQIDGTFRAAYFTAGDDAAGEPHAVVLDAEDRRLLAIIEANPGNNCTPTSPESFVTAYSVPVRSDKVPNWRTMKANVAARGGFEQFTHEGVWIPSDVGVRIIAYHGVTSTSGYSCNGTGYTLFPLKIDSTKSPSPVYDDYPPIPGYTPLYGRAAGDALWNTWKTMVSFKALGRNGWDGNNGDARIVVHSGAEQGVFIQAADFSAPAMSVRVGRANRMHPLSASLDLVAHEWGHGVIFKEANFDRSTPYGQQLHEGFADIIGQLVEKRVQPGGTNVEQSSDFVLHEDSAVSGYSRGAEDDEADGTAGHLWVGPQGQYFFNDRLHALDPSYDAQVHSTGNMLNVVYRILSAGGSTDLPSGLNPICARLPNLAGCDSLNVVTFNERLGPAKAGELLFYAIQHTLTSGETWESVADRVNEAAFQKYNTCSSGVLNNASAEQKAVRKAFAGIGYPRTTGDKKCPGAP